MDPRDPFNPKVRDGDDFEPLRFEVPLGESGPMGPGAYTRPPDLDELDDDDERY
jgi:hypothetical protein